MLNNGWGKTHCEICDMYDFTDTMIYLVRTRFNFTASYIFSYQVQQEGASLQALREGTQQKA